MNERIQQGFTDCIFRIIHLVNAFQAFKRRGSAIAEWKIGIAVVKLLEHRAAKFLCIFERDVLRIPEYRNFRRMLTLVWQQQRQICVLIVVYVPHTQSDVFILCKFYFIAFECRRSLFKGQILL